MTGTDLQAVFLTWNFLPQTDVAVGTAATGSWLAVLLVGVGAGIAWVVRRPPYSAIQRRAVVILACGFTVVGLIGVWSLRYTADATVTSLRQTLEQVFRPSVPKDAIACQGSVSAECAQTAADRVGHAVAWVHLPRSRDLVLAAIDRAGLAFEDAYDAAKFSGLSVESPPQTNPDGKVVQIVIASGVRGQVRQTNDGDYAGSVQIDWQYRGQRYEMSGFTFFRAPSRADIDALIALWRSVQYAEPSS